MQAKSLEAAVSLGQGDIEKFLFRVFHGTVDSVAILIANFITPMKKRKKRKKKERTSSSNRRYHAEEVDSTRRGRTTSLQANPKIHREEKSGRKRREIGAESRRNKQNSGEVERRKLRYAETE